MFIWLTMIIAVVSIALAFVSLKKEQTNRELKHVGDELSRGRVIFHASSAEEDSSSESL